MKKSLFNTAATCFREAGEFEMEKIAKCHQKALDASKYVQKINFIHSIESKRDISFGFFISWIFYFQKYIL